MKLLNEGNTKTRKGEKKGWMTFGIHLAPANLSGFNVCKDASVGCAAACLNTAGRGVMSSVQKARIAKTRLFFTNKDLFLTQLHKEITAGIKKAGKKGMRPCFRLNLTSDLPWEKIKHKGKTILEHFPNVQFYDYTKIVSRVTSFLSCQHQPLSWGGAMLKEAQGGNDWPKNYHLTFSRSESNQALVEAVAASLGNVAAVFRGKLPKKYLGLPVVNGDETDLRFLDPKGCVVGLVEKGLAKKDHTGFVLEA